MELDRVFVQLRSNELRVLLSAVARRLDGGFTEREAERYCNALESSNADPDLLIEPIVSFNGQELPLIIDVLGRETDTFELVFIVPPVLSRVIQEEVRVRLGRGAAI